MHDFLDVLAEDAKRTVKEGFYERVDVASAAGSLRKAITSCRKAAIIAEVKPASPSMGVLCSTRSPAELAREMEEGGAVGLSVLTEPKHFGGSLSLLATVRKNVGIPLLMKDIVVSPVQVDAAAKAGASAILLMYTVFERGYAEESLEDMIDYAHRKGLEVLLETHTEEEFAASLNMEADMLGVNNRDLRTLKVDLNVTKRILSQHNVDRVVVSESGIESPEDVRFLRACGAKAFLVGTSIMKASDVRMKVRSLVEAL